MRFKFYPSSALSAFLPELQKFPASQGVESWVQSAQVSWMKPSHGFAYIMRTDSFDSGPLVRAHMRSSASAFAYVVDLCTQGSLVRWERPEDKAVALRGKTNVARRPPGRQLACLGWYLPPAKKWKTVAPRLFFCLRGPLCGRPVRVCVLPVNDGRYISVARLSHPSARCRLLLMPP